MTDASQSEFTSPPPFQFSLRSIFALTTLVALGLVLFTTMPWLLLILGVILVLGILPTALLILAIYARGTVRTFAIGALVPLTLGMLPAQGLPPNSLIMAPLVAAVCGAVAVWVRRLIRQRGWDEPEPCNGEV